MGQIIFEGWIPDNDPRYNETSVIVGKTLSLAGRRKREPNAEADTTADSTNAPDVESADGDSSAATGTN